MSTKRSLFETILLNFLIRDLDKLSKDVVLDIVQGRKEVRRIPEYNETLTLDDMAELDNEYRDYIKQ